MKPVSTRRMAVLLGGLAMFGPFSIDTIFPAFPQMAAQFGADKLAMQQLISVYLFAYAGMSLLHGPLSDALGRRRVIIAGLVVFTAASVGCALAPSFPVLLAFRGLQGLSAGVGLIVGRAVIRDVLQGDDAQRLMSQVTMIFGVAPAIAPILGGWMLQWGRWPLIFWFLVAFSLLLLVATAATLPETHPVAARVSLQPRELLRVYASIASNRRFLRLTFAGAFNFAALFLYIASAPAFVLDLLKLDEQSFGWFFVPMIVGMVSGSFVSGRMAGRVSGVRQVEIGFVCTGVAALVNIAYSLLVPQPQLPWAVLPIALNAFGVGLVFPILTLTILDMFPRQRGSASSLQAFAGLIFNAVIAALLSPLLSNRSLHLALCAGAFTAIGWLFWLRDRRSQHPPIPSGTRDSAALEPIDEL